MRPITDSNGYVPVRRQMESITIFITRDEGITPAPIPTLTAQIRFTDFFRRPSDNDPTWKDVPEVLTVAHDEIMGCHPSALPVLGALTQLFETKATAAGI